MATTTTTVIIVTITKNGEFVIPGRPAPGLKPSTKQKIKILAKSVLNSASKVTIIKIVLTGSTLVENRGNIRVTNARGRAGLT
jgi:hypothetical protein